MRKPVMPALLVEEVGEAPRCWRLKCRLTEVLQELKAGNERLKARDESLEDRLLAIEKKIKTSKKNYKIWFIH